MSTLSTHVLDAVHGRPVSDLAVVLSGRAADGSWVELRRARTDANGRVADLAPAGSGLARGEYRLHFDTGAWFAANGVAGFYPEVSVVFVVADEGHHHVPLLLSPFAYSTYRGS